jgi:IMP and pyridine-specific 5'-nucleotidase
VFNGGRDVWVDIGNKLIGVQTLQKLLATEPNTTLHVGDQFLSTGNDIATVGFMKSIMGHSLIL